MVALVIVAFKVPSEAVTPVRMGWAPPAGCGGPIMTPLSHAVFALAAVALVTGEARRWVHERRALAAL